MSLSSGQGWEVRVCGKKYVIPENTNSPREMLKWIL